MSRDGLVAARDQLRKEFDARHAAVMNEDTRRFEDAQTSWMEANDHLQNVRVRLGAAQKRQAEALAHAKGSESKAAALPADSPEREELLESARRARVDAAAEDQIIARHAAEVPRLTALTKEREEAVKLVDAEHVERIDDLGDAEEQIDRLENKIRLMDKEAAASANAREAEADAEALEMQGDAVGAAASRADAARFRAEAEQAARDNAQISVDATQLAEAGLTVTDDVAELAASGPTPAEQLNDRAFDVAEQAKALRDQLTETTEAKFSEIGIARDRAAREQYAKEQAAKSADAQLRRELDAAKTDNDSAAREEAKAVAAEKRGDHRAAEELRENAQSLRSSAEVHANRAEHVRIDKADLEKDAADLKARVAELEGEKTALVQSGGAAAKELDKMEDQSRLLLEAAQKTEAAARLPPDDPRVATLQAEAQKALDEAAKLDADEATIHAGIPVADAPAAAPSPSSHAVEEDAAPPAVAGPNTPDEVRALAAAGPVSTERLHDSASDLADRAHTMRSELTSTTEAKFSEIGIARDRAAREQYSAEEAAKSARVQLRREEAAAKSDAELAAKEDAKAAAAEQRGDARAAEEFRENAQSLRSSADVHTKRAEQALVDKVDLDQQAANLKARVAALEAEKAALVQSGGAAAKELDKMEDQSRLLLEASHKAEQADALPPTDPRGAALRAQAQEALDEAAKLDVDEGRIQVVLPNAPVTAAAATSEEAVLDGVVDDSMSVDDELALLLGEPDGDPAVARLAGTTDGLGLPDDEVVAMFTADDLAGSEPHWVEAEQVEMGGGSELEANVVTATVEQPDFATPAFDTGATVDLPEFEQPEFDQPDTVAFASVADTSEPDLEDDVATFDDVDGDLG